MDYNSMESHNGPVSSMSTFAELTDMTQASLAGAKDCPSAKQDEFPQAGQQG